MRRVLLILAFVATTTSAAAESLLSEAWPARPDARLHELGWGIAVVFSPDLSVPGTCDFYSLLGFACFRDSDWSNVLSGVRSFNIEHADRSIRTLILETHGTNGHGLKLQDSYDREAARSYISAGALQERFEPDGVRFVIITACNAGRLLRPEIYRRLNREPGEKLFLPPTIGIHDASDDYDFETSGVTILTRAISQVEMTVVGSVRELSPCVLQALQRTADASGRKVPEEFVISDVMMQMIVRDEHLDIRRGTPAPALSRERTTAEESERLFSRFIKHLDFVARESQLCR